MKLCQFAVAAFAASMTAALAGDKFAMSDEKNAHGSMVSSDATSKAPAGYADKSGAAAQYAKQKDTQAGQTHGDTGLGVAVTAPNPGAPAGYADGVSTAQSDDMQNDTQRAQVRRDATVMSGEKNAPGSMVSSGATSTVPSGYADKSNAAAQSATQMDQTGKMHGDAGLGVAATAPNPGAPAGYADGVTTAPSADMQSDTHRAQELRDTTVSPSATAPNPGAPAGYADGVSSDKTDGMQDTQRAQSK